MSAESVSKDVEMKDADAVATEAKNETEPMEQDITGDGGILKKILKAGEGDAEPPKGAEVKVHYVGKLLDGTTFDSSRDRNEVFKFRLGEGQVIKGWEKGIRTMKKGELALFTIQPDYAYGKNGSPPKIPPNATLQFEVELIDWNDEEDISEKKDGGLLKKVIKKGEGWAKPKEDAKVTVNYTALLSDGTKFEEKQNFQFIYGEEEGLLPSFENAIKSMKKGEKAVFTVAPKYGFGSDGNSSKNVPPNEYIKYEIELVDFENEKEYWDMTVDEIFENAAKLKNEGNTLYSQGKIERAAKKYKKAIGLFTQEHRFDTDELKTKANQLKLPCHLNLAMCQLKLKKYKDAKDNCNKALEIDGKNIKALFRRGIAYSESGDWNEAKADFMKCLEMEPENKDVKKELTLLKRKIAEQNAKDKKAYAGMFEKLAAKPQKSK